MTLSTQSPGGFVLLGATFLILTSPAISRAQEDSPQTPKLSESKPAVKATLRNARKLALEGAYDRAIGMYEELAQTPRLALRAVCGRAEVDLLVGDYRKGVERLLAVEADGNADATWNAVLAALEADVGRYDDAIRHNRKAVELDENNMRARYQLGRLLESLGRIDEAVNAYRFFDEAMTGADLPDRAENLTYLGLGFYRFSTLTRHRDIVRRTRHVLTEVLQEAFEFVDADYWPARLASAELLLDKHNLSEAKQDFEAILKQNPKAALAHVGLGRIALEEWNFEEVDAHVAKALAINPSCIAGRVLEADCRMTERKYEEAMKAAEAALAVNPNSFEALSVKAAAHTRLGDEKSARDVITTVNQLNKRPAVLHNALGTWHSAGRQYEPAEKHFKQAIEFAPWWPAPRTALGQVYMDTGEEKLARQTLEASFALDSFDSHTHNVLELLDVIDHFQELETEHFIIKFNKQIDGIAAPYLAEALERFHPDVCKHFETTLDKKTIIEVFTDHMGFSVRVTGRPFIATVGACSGRVIAMVAPRGQAPFGRFNWATMLRHEFTHTVTLAATENRIPHWMTEGLAVLEETAPRSWSTKQLLCNALRQDRLFTLKSIDWGFMRPRRPDDRHLAYMQSEWMFEYIMERHGDRAIGDFLKAFRNGQTQEQAFRQVISTPTEEFDREFKAWAKLQIGSWGLPTDLLRDKEVIRNQLDGSREVAWLWGEFAESELLDGEFESAEEAARRGLDLDKDEIKSLEVLSHVLIGKMLGKEKEAERNELVNEVDPYLRSLIRMQPENPVATKYIGFVEQAWSQWKEAITWLSRYQERYPDDPDSYRRLAGIYLHLNDVDKALAQLEQLFRLSEDEPAVATQVADIYLDRKQPKVAAEWYRRAMEVDPYDPKTHAGLGEALLQSGANEDAVKEFNVVCTLWPEKPVGYNGLARAYEAMGNHEKAAKYKLKADGGK